MKSETEIKGKLDYYEAVLAGMESGRMIDNPDIFLRLSQHFPREAMEMLNDLASTEAQVNGMPSEDQPWVREWFGSLTGFAREALRSRISVLGWVLERAGDDGGG